MKKISIALLTFVVALTATSCRKENPTGAETTLSGKEMTICAESGGITATPTKVEMAYKYDLLWQTNDEIFVKKGSTGAAFKLQGGEGTTKGTFTCQTSPFQAGDEVDAYYPKSIVCGESLVWPATLTNNQTVPMYCKKTLTSTENQTFNFNSLGSVLQLIFSTTSKDVVLRSIEVNADQAMSGNFTINEKGEAVITQPDGADKPGVTLDLGDTGTDVGVTARKFNIAIPAGTYTNLTITFTAKDGKKCIKHATSAQTIAYNEVNTLAISGELNFVVPEGALPGVFTVADYGNGNTKKVFFSKGNLYYDGTNWGFEAEQYNFHGYDSANNTWGLFGWVGASSTTLTDPEIYGAMGELSADYGDNPNDVLKADWGKTIDDKGTWTTLSGGPNGEWKYLFDNHINIWGQCHNVPGRFIAPDGYKGDKSTLSVAVADWANAQKSGIVFLPAAGYRDEYTVCETRIYGRYWSSSPSSGIQAHNVYFYSNDVMYMVSIRKLGCSVRLVTEFK